jgi:hypothetical protein
MPQLLSVRLIDVGHKDARMEDLTIPLARKGAPVDSIVWLRNGGGKSSIINLCFSVVRPSLREFLGARADQGKRHLSDYVQAEDHTVIAKLWLLDDDAASRYLTIGFYERKKGGTSSDIPERHFFAGRVVAGVEELSLPGLPLYGVRPNGERFRRTLSGFRLAWNDLAREHPHAGLIETDNQTQWEQTLSDAGIDPGLFRFQLEMNRREGGADELFRFDSTEEFVDFFLDMVVDPEDGDQVAKNLAEHRDTLRKLTTEYQPGREFCASAIETLGPLVELGRERNSAYHQAAAHKRSVRRLESHVGGRVGELLDAAEAARNAATDANRRARDLRITAKRLLGESLSIERTLAQVALRKADESLKQASVDHQAAQRRQQIWTAAVPLADVRRHEAEVRRLSTELQDRQREHQPLFDALANAARRYDAVLRHRIGRLERESEEAGEKEARARATAAEHQALQRKAFGEGKEAARDAQYLRNEIAKEERERHNLRDRGLLEARESVVDGVARWDTTGRGAEGEAARLEEERLSVAGRGREKVEERNSANSETVRVAERVSQIERDVQTATREAESLEANTYLRIAVETEQLNIDRLDAPSVLEVLRTRIARASDTVRDLHIALAEHERALSYLETNKLLPPSPDVERLLTALNTRLPNATSGWRYVASTLPDKADDLIRTRPWLAAGIIVGDGDLDAARDALASADLILEGPVVVAPQSAVHESDFNLASGIVVGPTSRALYSEEAARLERIRRETLKETQTADWERYRQEEEAYRALHAKIEGFRQRYPAGWFADQAAERRRLVEDQAQWTERVEILRVEIRELDERGEALRAEIAEAGARAHAAEQNRALLEDHLDRWGNDDDLAVRQNALAALLQAELEARERASRHEELTGVAEALAEEERKRVLKTREELAPLKTERNAIQHLEDADPLNPFFGSIEEHRREYDLRRARYREEVREDELRGQLDTYQREAERARRAFEEELRDLEVAEVEAALDSIDPEDLSRRKREAETELRSVFGQLGQRGEAARRAREQLESVDRQCDEYGDVPLMVDVGDGDPEDRAIAARLEADEAQERAEEAETIAETSEQRASEYDSLRLMLEANRSRLRDLGESYDKVLRSEQEDEPDDAWVPPIDNDVGRVIDSFSGHLRDLQAAHARLDHRRTRLVSRVKEVLEHPAYASLRGNHIQKLRRYTDADFEVKAEIDYQDLSDRKQVIEDEIAQVEPHKQALVIQLLDVASKGLRTLESAQRRSRVPEDVPVIGGLDFLKVSTDAPEDVAARKERIARLIEDLTAPEAKLPDGRSLVHQAVRRLGKPIKVRVLKPKLSGEPEWLGIVPMGKESGGERLTSAIMLYCTMARMRAVTRGNRTSPLLLDNPIGAASWEPFLDLQRRVADRSGVQLIYFTGVDALGAIRAMSHVVRLRNARRDRWSGMALVEREDEAIESVRVDFGPDPVANAGEAVVVTGSPTDDVVTVRSADGDQSDAERRDPLLEASDA